MTSETAIATKPLAAHAGAPLKGRVRVPGDKSISHRALMLGALATGVTRLTGLLEAEDVLNTARALQALGAPIEKVGNEWRVTGRGVGGLRQPEAPAGLRQLRYRDAVDARCHRRPRHDGAH